MAEEVLFCRDCYWWNDGCAMTFDWDAQPKAGDPACCEFDSAKDVRKAMLKQQARDNSIK